MTFEEMLESPFKDVTFSVVDVETTGLGPIRNRIIEFAAVKVKNFEVIDTYHTFIDPEMYVPHAITELTGITDADVEDAPTFHQVVGDIISFLEGTVFTAHNAAFDIGFMRAELLRCGIEAFHPLQLCTLRLARRLYPDHSSHKLDKVCSLLRIKRNASHRALADAEDTAGILKKMLRKLKREHKHRTLDDVINFQYKSARAIKSRIIDKKLGNDLSILPDAPGIYYFLNGKNDIIYIGKAKSLRNRIRSHISDNAQRKSKKIMRYARNLKTEITNSELTACITEAELIKRIKPRLNVQLKKYQNKYFLRINNDEKFPRIELINHFDFDGSDYFGMFISRKKAVLVLDIIDKSFMLRECSDREFKSNGRCILGDIERCTKPCKNQDEKEYKAELEKVYDFLRGNTQFVFNRLIKKMKDYSARKKFEQAGEVKTMADLVLQQIHKASLLSEPINAANVLIEVSEDRSRKDYLLMLEGKVHIKSYALSKEDDFDTALEDFFSGTRRLDFEPDEEDLEKMKIIMNWIIRNRNKVRIFYLRDYNSKEELYGELSRFAINSRMKRESTFNIKELAGLPE